MYNSLGDYINHILFLRKHNEFAHIFNNGNMDQLGNLAMYGTDEYRDKLLKRYPNNILICNLIALYGNKQHVKVLTTHYHEGVRESALSRIGTWDRDWFECSYWKSY